MGKLKDFLEFEGLLEAIRYNAKASDDFIKEDMITFDMPPDFIIESLEGVKKAAIEAINACDKLIDYVCDEAITKLCEHCGKEFHTFCNDDKRCVECDTRENQ